MSNSTRKHLMRGVVVKLDVGVPPVPFNVHIQLLCGLSPAFAELYSGILARTIQERINVPEEDPNTFAVFVNWMYWNRVCMNQPLRVLNLFKLWVLADKLGIPTLQNDAITLCKKRVDRGAIGTDAVAYAYESTLPGSPLRRMAVDSWVCKAGKKRFRAHMATFPHGFLQDLCSVFFGRKDPNRVQFSGQQHFECCYFMPDFNPGSKRNTVLAYNPSVAPAEVKWRRRHRLSSTLHAPICDRFPRPDTVEHSNMKRESSVKSEGTADNWSTDTDEIPLPTNKKRKLVRSGH